VKSKKVPKLKKLKTKPSSKLKTYSRDVKSPQVQALLKSVKTLLDWYRNQQRTLPWRKDNPSPYHVWISEIMLQQSTMQSVLPYFDRWIKKFPNIEDLAKASESEVLNLWQGLGYYQRARNLHRAAQEILLFMASNKRWPKSIEEWKSFPGVGEYTAAAIASIVYNEKVLPVDGNVIRVLSRYWDIKNPLNNSKDLESIKNNFEFFAKKLAQGHHRDLAQAFMELGALICRPGSDAKCILCPLNKECRAYSLKTQTKIPIPKKKPPAVNVLSLNLIYRGDDNSPILRKIPKGRRLAGQWELPQYEIITDKPKELMSRYQRVFESVGPLRHSITKHRYWAWGLNLGAWGPSKELPEGHRQLSDLGEHETLTTLSRKILFEVEKSEL
jgi:A/G-specific adenine glycosylase